MRNIHYSKEKSFEVTVIAHEYILFMLATSTKEQLTYKTWINNRSISIYKDKILLIIIDITNLLDSYHNFLKQILVGSCIVCKLFIREVSFDGTKDAYEIVIVKSYPDASA